MDSCQKVYSFSLSIDAKKITLLHLGHLFLGGRRQGDQGSRQKAQDLEKLLIQINSKILKKLKKQIFKNLTLVFPWFNFDITFYFFGSMSAKEFPGSAPGSSSGQGRGETTKSSDFEIKAPTISLPKGGGAIKGIGEKFAANPVTGTGTMTVPIATSAGRSGFGPQLSLSYDSAGRNNCVCIRKL